jgi:hypothetical protein
MTNLVCPGKPDAERAPAESEDTNGAPDAAKPDTDGAEVCGNVMDRCVFLSKHACHAWRFGMDTAYAGRSRFISFHFMHPIPSLPTAEQQLPTVQPMDSLLGPDAPPIVVHQPPSDQELACALRS